MPCAFDTPPPRGCTVCDACRWKVETMGILYLVGVSMGWLKGKSTGNHRFSLEIWDFCPVIFASNQSIDGRTLPLWKIWKSTGTAILSVYGKIKKCSKAPTSHDHMLPIGFEVWIADMWYTSHNESFITRGQLWELDFRGHLMYRTLDENCCKWV